MVLTHRNADLLDPNYISPPSNEAILAEMNTILYSIVVTTLQASKYWKFLRSYSTSSSARYVWFVLGRPYSEGTAADLKVDQLEAEIPSMKIDTRWNHSLESFFDEGT